MKTTATICRGLPLPLQLGQPKYHHQRSLFHPGLLHICSWNHDFYYLTPQPPDFLQIDAPANMGEKLKLTSTKFSCSRLSSTSQSQGKPAKFHRVKSRSNRRKEKGKSTFHCANIFCWHSIANSIPKTILQGLPFPRQKLTGFQIRKNTQHEKSTERS
jgi:hypothetical protein